MERERERERVREGSEGERGRVRVKWWRRLCTGEKEVTKCNSLLDGRSCGQWPSIYCWVGVHDHTTFEGVARVFGDHHNRNHHISLVAWHL